MALLEETCIGIFSDKEKMIESISEEQHTSNIAYTLVHVTTPFRYTSRTFFFFLKGNSYLQRHPVLNPFITWLSHAHHNQQWLTGCCCLTSPFHIAQLSLRVAVYSSCSPHGWFYHKLWLFSEQSFYPSLHFIIVFDTPLHFVCSQEFLQQQNLS